MGRKKAINEESGGFNPEGSGYDYDAAEACGLSPDSTGHWPSRCPKTGQILKGKKHKTWNKTVKEETEEGYTVYKENDGKYYSRYKEGE